MKYQGQLAIVAAAVIVVFAAPVADAGGTFGLYLDGGGFGVSVGVGDWSVYTRSWSDPHWSINFEATLAGYGEWVWVGGVGRVWRPWVSAGWRPYLHGRWVYTVHGWNWVAYEPWGYVPHHYGNWAYASVGWVWVPGYNYVGANVVWVRAGGYVGWYARPPRGWSHAGRGFHHGYRHGFDDGYGTGYRDGWNDARYANYVDWRHFGTENVSHHAVDHGAASRSRIVDRAAVPTTTEIRRNGGVQMTTVPVARRTVSMAGREITIARPEGVADSIERHARDTVSQTLGPQAIERRQPMVRPSSARSSSPQTTRRDPSVRSQSSPESTRRSTRQSAAPNEDRPRESSSVSARQSFSGSRSTVSRDRPERSAGTRPSTAAGARQSAPAGSRSRISADRERVNDHRSPRAAGGSRTRTAGAATSSKKPAPSAAKPERSRASVQSRSRSGSASDRATANSAKPQPRAGAKSSKPARKRR